MLSNVIPGDFEIPGQSHPETPGDYDCQCAGSIRFPDFQIAKMATVDAKLAKQNATKERDRKMFEHLNTNYKGLESIVLTDENSKQPLDNRKSSPMSRLASICDVPIKKISRTVLMNFCLWQKIEKGLSNTNKAGLAEHVITGNI